MHVPPQSPVLLVLGDMRPCTALHPSLADDDALLELNKPFGELVCMMAENKPDMLLMSGPSWSDSGV